MKQILKTRRDLYEKALPYIGDGVAEGGCGVLGLTANQPIAGRHVLTASAQMHNRGNGKGGGIAMAGLDPAQMRVDAETLKTHYLLQIALLDPTAREEVEAQFITPHFDVAQSYEIDRMDEWEHIGELDVRPPDVWRYFVRVKPDVLEQFAAEHDLGDLEPRAIEDEFVYRNSFDLNTTFYASLGEKRAFVLSHGRDLIVLKIVGYAEDVVEYYKLHEQTAHVWIAHQRYPTKGRMWHPGGAHPFIGLNEALVHNGDFANYHAVTEYLKQRNIAPLFLTDTEVSVLLFDLFDRIYNYPLEVTLEAMAPTTEFDYMMLPDDKKRLYRAVQATHMHGSPDGPWFFILARSKPDEGMAELLGITDTSMLRPQVFALFENEDVEIGLIASERQAINACLRSLTSEDKRYKPVADKYWVARGGSYTDGGAFRFTYNPNEGLTCANKFEEPVTLTPGKRHADPDAIEPENTTTAFRSLWEENAFLAFDNGGAPTMWTWISENLADMTWDEIAWGTHWMQQFAQKGDNEWHFALETLSLMRDRPAPSGEKKRASLLTIVDEGIIGLCDAVPCIDDGTASRLTGIRRLTFGARDSLVAPADGQSTLVFDTLHFTAEGDQAAARYMTRAARLGWKHFVAYNWRGGRFAAAGIGEKSDGIRVDLYGDVGDYTASGLDGGEVHIHGAGQDQLGQILRSGKLVIHGDVGQTFLYGAKGGEIYVRGSAAGRPLINAVGKPRAVINGTCLDYLAESFMAGDPLAGGGFVILNGITVDEDGTIEPMETPYPGGNLLSLASGGAIYVRDPHHTLSEEQLNGAAFFTLSDADWELIEPYLRENERLFDIPVEVLLTVDGEQRPPEAVYRKVGVAELSGVLKESENR